MASLGFNISRSGLLDGTLDLDGSTLRMLLLKTASTAEGTLRDYDDLNAFLGDSGVTEADATNYSRQGVSNVSISVDDANDRAELTFDNVTFSSLGGGTDNTIVAAVIYKQVGGDDSTPGDDIPVALYDIADFTTNGSDVTLVAGSEGALQVT